MATEHSTRRRSCNGTSSQESLASSRHAINLALFWQYLSHHGSTRDTEDEFPFWWALLSWLLEHYYRVLLSTVSTSSCILAQVLIKNKVGMYIIARMLLGVGILFAIISGSALIGELAFPKERPVLTSLFNASYFIGSIVAAAIAIRTTSIDGDWSWRLPSLLQICPSLLQICTVFLLPESPRWLISKDRDDEAFAILTKYHAEGDADSVLVKAEMAQIRSTIKLEMENSKQSWMDLFRTPGMRRRTLIAGFLGLFTQMSGNTLLSYYQNLLFGLIGYTTDYAKTRINIANQCWSLANATVIALIITRFRRRWMFMLSAASMTLVFMSMTICFQRLELARDNDLSNKSAQYAALFFYFAYSPCYNIGNNSLTYTYLVELFPYAQRSMGIGFEQIFGKLGGFFSINVNPIAMKALSWKYFAIYCGWISFEFMFVYFMYPETYNRTLEELTFCKSQDSQVGIGIMLTMRQCSRTRHLQMRLSRLWRSRSTARTWTARSLEPSRTSQPSSVPSNHLILPIICRSDR